VSVSGSLYRCAQVRALDAAAITAGTPGIVLMKRAGRAAFRHIEKYWPQQSRLCIICGSGNNGGDGFVIAALAASRNMRVSLYCTRIKSDLKGDAALAAAYAEQEGVKILNVHQLAACSSEDLIVDCLLGSGLSGELRSEEAEIIAWMNSQSCPRFAIDIPSGLNSDTGQAMGNAVNAQHTLSFIAPKCGMYTASAANYCGQRYFDALNLSEEVLSTQSSDIRLLDAEVYRLLPPRRRDDHKGKNGHCLIAGGDEGMGGAAILAAEQALMAGAGLVSLLTRKSHLCSVLARSPEIMVSGSEDNDSIQKKLKQANVAVIGPGLGQSEWSRYLLNAVISSELPLVLDADALNLLAEQKFDEVHRCVLTPHPGEAARLLSCSVADVQNDRFAAAAQLRDRFGATIVLKGSGSIVATVDKLYLCPLGNPGMAAGGMGDALAGLIGALIAQGLSPEQAACLGVYAHAAAADKCAAITGERGMKASELASQVRILLNQ
jgi:hydroxyethylthiazole kinase-like uncharacterized protein yjeF